jgi:hypothetical protein
MRYQLTAKTCTALRNEIAAARERLAYLYAIEDYAGVVATARRCRASLRFYEEYATGEDRESPCRDLASVVLMQTRAAVLLALQEEELIEAHYHVERGLQDLLNIFTNRQALRAYDRNKSVRSLERLRRELVERLIPTPRASLRNALHVAIRDERYEEAAKLRDQLRKKKRA